MKKGVRDRRAAGGADAVAGRLGGQQERGRRGHLRAPQAVHRGAVHRPEPVRRRGAPEGASSTARSRAPCAGSTRTRSFLDPEMYREMQVETTGSFGGLGIEITLRDDVLTVVAPIEGTPAYRAGVQSGDRIVKIDGHAHQGHAARRRGQAHARQARHQDHHQHHARGLGRAQGLRDHPRADPRAIGEDAGAGARHRVHPAAPVPGADGARISRPSSTSTPRRQGRRRSSSTCATTRAAS